MTYKASVIIPVYKCEKTLRRCLDSVLLGTERDIEVILADDCSPDKSGEICREYAQKYSNVRYFRNDKNMGVSYTRNRGLDEAQGKYILFVDSDDWVSGNYIEKMLAGEVKRPNTMPVCGYTFIDYVNGGRRQYLFDNDSRLLTRDTLWELLDKILLRQLWNKTFETQRIRSAGIRFDESSTMGEDFQFVLDYIAAGIEELIPVNEPLYYYIRANNSSLMSKFGLVENKDEFLRLEKLHKLSGAKNEDKYLQAVKNTKLNHVYRIAHSTGIDRQKKLALIEHIMQDGKAADYYHDQSTVMLKERTAAGIDRLKKLPRRVMGRINREKQASFVKRQAAKLNNRDFTLISQNCIGGVFYHDMGLEFKTPTVNLYFTGPDFVKLANNPEYYMSLNPEMYWGEEYPLGRLGDITIRFMHYDNCREAYDAWERRKARINWNKLLIISTDMEDFGQAEYRSWQTIKYPGLLFTAQGFEGEGILHFKPSAGSCAVGDLISSREFYKSDALINAVNKL